jgi:hypothetical protein
MMYNNPYKMFQENDEYVQGRSGNLWKGGTSEQMKDLAFSWKYLSLLLYLESGTPAQQLSSTFPPF